MSLSGADNFKNSNLEGLSGFIEVYNVSKGQVERHRLYIHSCLYITLLSFIGVIQSL